MQRNPPYDYHIKLLIIGSSGVGKTNILCRYCENSFIASHLATIGIDFKTKIINLGKDKLKLQIWDTAGQQKFKTLTQTYYRNAMGVIITYAVNDRQTFDEVENWVKQIQLHASDNIMKVLVGNKSDLQNRKVSEEQGQSLAKQIGMNFFQTSAKTGRNIEQLFQLMAERIKKRIDEDEKKGVLFFTGAKILKKDDRLGQGQERCC